MRDLETTLYWINHEIPPFLNKFNSFDEFDEAMPSTCASGEWKRYAYAMAKGKWSKDDEIKHIPR